MQPHMPEAFRLYDGPTGSPLLTTTEAAALLSVAPRTMEDWRRSGRGPTFVALSRNAVRYRLVDLEAWVESRRAPHTAKARAIFREDTSGSRRQA